MTADPSWNTQTALYARLTAALPDVRIVDNVEAAEFERMLPFVLIGNDALVDAENQCVDEYELRAFIHCHAAGPARKAAKQLAHRVREALKADIPVEGFQSEHHHTGTRSQLVEGIAHLVIVEVEFQLVEDADAA